MAKALEEFLKAQAGEPEAPAGLKAVRTYNVRALLSWSNKKASRHPMAGPPASTLLFPTMRSQHPERHPHLDPRSSGRQGDAHMNPNTRP